MIKNNIAL